MTGVRKFQVAVFLFALLLFAGVSIFMAFSLRNLVSPPPEVYEGGSIPPEYSHHFEQYGVPPTATDIRLYHEPWLRGGDWLRARLKPDELATFAARHEHIDKAATLPDSLAEWLPEPVSAWFPTSKTDDLTVFEYSSAWFVMVDQRQCFVYVMQIDD